MRTSKHPGLWPLDLRPRELAKTFCQKIKEFEIFLDVHMDTSVIDNNIKKIIEIFYFLAKFLYSNANAGCDKKHFCYKIFCLHQN